MDPSAVSTSLDRYIPERSLTMYSISVICWCPMSAERAIVTGSTLEPFSGVEIHMEMDMDWKWMEMDTFCENVMDWFGFGVGHQPKMI